jgi:hypothetical protein
VILEFACISFGPQAWPCAWPFPLAHFLFHFDQGALMPVLGIFARKLGVRLSIFVGSFIFSLGFFLTNWTIQVLGLP